MARLDIRFITEAAVQLLDEVGLADLSTRRLAAKLGVQSPTLYWHVKNKAELLDLVAEAICADAFDIDTSLPWRDQLASGLRQFRQLLIAHRDAATLLRERPPSGPHRLGHIETTVKILLDAGFPESEAAGIARLLAAHVLTTAQHELRMVDPGEGDYPSLRRVAEVQMSSEQLFELGIGILLDGLEQHLMRVAPRPPASRS
ncbi:TetR/AcrR family transcriptional regulator C-terminal domain-containing protein [Kibdelosporangium philippinense]|uniref:TetR/AcrR family transcriptional regulator C-terminal domain-containing protein n=1 Tax=Kibdelosporangium philippinense TaxID=211113 RepID=A0ABS8ZDU6_9PSEU|nr:TetR/AcrR family transcriptional regulator C-terminal domain-containing protein [Kibdelosporangium philippinense]MCE7004002.1 TetR/AcrR family transcriptional regulator C-terminal domain-containing protein [Kibdelosporangium philippinense]